MIHLSERTEIAATIFRYFSFPTDLQILLL